MYYKLQQKMNKNGYFEEFEFANFNRNGQSYQGGNSSL